MKEKTELRQVVLSSKRGRESFLKRDQKRRREIGLRIFSKEEQGGVSLWKQSAIIPSSKFEREEWEGDRLQVACQVQKGENRGWGGGRGPIYEKKKKGNDDRDKHQPEKRGHATGA